MTTAFMDKIEDHTCHFTVVALIFFTMNAFGFIEFSNPFQLSCSVKECFDVFEELLDY